MAGSLAFKQASLGESPLASGVAGLLSLSAAGSLVFLIRHSVHPFLSLVAAYCVALPLAKVGRRFAQLQLEAAEGALLFYPYGTLLPGRRIPCHTIRSLSELRLSDDDPRGPLWTLALTFVDGTQERLGKFINPNIHELVADLNIFIRAGAHDSA